jgi:hypothetical protein
VTKPLQDTHQEISNTAVFFNRFDSSSTKQNQRFFYSTDSFIFFGKLRADRLHSARIANSAALAVDVLLAGFTHLAHYLELFPNSIADLK